MARCSLCGGKLDYRKKCTLCGLDNTKNDSQYKGMINKHTCDGKPMTHVHEETAQPIQKNAGYKASTSTQYKRVNTQHKSVNAQYTRPTYTKTVHTKTTSTQNATQSNQPKSPKKRAVKWVAILVVICNVLPAIFSFIGDVVDDIVNEVSVIAYEDDIIYEDYLEAGMYQVGVHIPTGNYKIELEWGEDGFVEVLQYVGDSISSDNYYALNFDEDLLAIEDVYLDKGEILTISAGIGIRITSTDADYYDISGEDNLLTESYTINSKVVAGVDFPAGVYDIYYNPLYEEECGNVYYQIWSDEKQAPIIDDFQYFDYDMGETVYCNLPLTEGSVLWLEGLSGVVISPSEWVGSVEYNTEETSVDVEGSL